MFLYDDKTTFYNCVSDTTLLDFDNDFVPWPGNFNKQALKNYEVQLLAKLKLCIGCVRKAV